ncbi:MAG TPA: succinate dehydrogenase cytochrome b subunit, partial [Vicinamibacteria bacterium]|nr:succinate dehydrogenase cytochrome b subunit [Vicinamibacteria bacterium]
MSQPASFLRSSLGRKVIMAFTGVILFGFVIGHMVGNLQVYQGPEKLNAYAETLRHFGPLLWLVRLVLLATVALHIWAAASLTRSNLSARAVGYDRFQPQSSTYASRTMRWSGVILLLFIVYHLLHFTFGTRAVHPQFVPGDVYHNFITGFQNPLVSFFYILSMLALGLHLYHGAWSILQTVGLSHPRLDRVRYGLAAAITAIIVLGNISMPVAVMAGLLRDERSAPASAMRAGS